jgi:hypothetical protein
MAVRKPVDPYENEPRPLWPAVVRETPYPQPNTSTLVPLASGLNFIAGIWVLISPWAVGFTSLENLFINNLIVGGAVAVLAAIRSFGAYNLSWLSWLNTLLGVWLIASAFVFTTMQGAPNPFWNNAILGILIAILGIWSALSTDDGRAV